MNVVILGVSRFGLQCVQQMLAQKSSYTLTVIDRRAEAFNRLPHHHQINSVLGIGIDQDVLRKAGIEKADLFIGATNDDNTNLMAAQIAKVKFKVKRCIARVRDDGRGQVFNEMGLIEVVCPTLDAAKTLMKSLS